MKLTKSSALAHENLIHNKEVNSISHRSIDNSIRNEFFRKMNSFHNSENHEEILDRAPFQNNLRIAPLNNFDEYLINDFDPKKFLLKGAQRGLSRWREVNGEYAWKECEVLGYEEKTQTFLIKFMNSQIKKKVNRLNLLLAEENLEKFNERYKLAVERRGKALMIQNIDGYFLEKMRNFILIFAEEINKKTENLVYNIPEDMLNNICTKFHYKSHYFILLFLYWKIGFFKVKI